MRVVYSSRVNKTFQAARGYADAEFDDLADRQLVTSDVEERKKLVARMQQIVARDLPILHLYYPTPFLIYNRDTFDQWSTQYSDKQVFVTGARDGSLEIRPIKET
jgi:ABC-type transport system substrate-binding protein